MRGYTRGRGVRSWLLVAVLAPALLVVACGGDHDDEEDQPAAAPPRTATEGRETGVTLDARTQGLAGIAVTALQPVTHQGAVGAFGTVLDLSDLADARTAVAAAVLRVERAKSALAASSAEHRRIEDLNRDEHNASDKALETATAAWRRDDGELAAARVAVDGLLAAGRQHWGGVLAGWLGPGSPELDRLLQGNERLLQVTLPPGSALSSAPAVATVRAGDRPAVEARLVSPAPRTDPQIQGQSFFYSVAGPGAPLPGMNVRVSVPAGSPIAGVVVPSTAVVWWQGRAWVYVEKAPGRFARREVATEVPLPDGWFVTAGVAAGERIVTSGAQVLLSEEGRAAVHGSEG